MCEHSAIGANCWLLQARRLASSTHRFRRRAGVVLGHTRELVQYMPCQKCENEIIKITLATIAGRSREGRSSVKLCRQSEDCQPSSGWGEAKEKRGWGSRKRNARDTDRQGKEDVHAHVDTEGAAHATEGAALAPPSTWSWSTAFCCGTLGPGSAFGWLASSRSGPTWLWNSRGRAKPASTREAATPETASTKRAEIASRGQGDIDISRLAPHRKWLLFTEAAHLATSSKHLGAGPDTVQAFALECVLSACASLLSKL
jgi:hypothetical protein